MTPKTRTFLITVEQNGRWSQWTAKGETLSLAEVSIIRYIGECIFREAKEIF